MIGRHIVARHLVISGAIVATLAGCAATPMGPTVQVMPGPGKSFDTFQNDQAICKGFAAEQVKGQADAANTRAVGGAVLATALSAGLGAAVGGAYGNAGAGAALGAATGAGAGAAFGAGNTQYEQLSIQQQYNNAFSQCMYAKGELVPGFAPRRSDVRPVSRPRRAAASTAAPRDWVPPTDSGSVTPASAPSSGWVSPTRTP